MSFRPLITLKRGHLFNNAKEHPLQLRPIGPVSTRPQNTAQPIKAYRRASQTIPGRYIPRNLPGYLRSLGPLSQRKKENSLAILPKKPHDAKLQES